MSFRQRLFHIPPRTLGWAVLVLAAAYSIGVQTYSILRIARTQASVAAVIQADHQAVEGHTALLARVVADEKRMCLAATAEHEAAMIAILCPAPTVPAK